jgi:hypothetical protein
MVLAESVHKRFGQLEVLKGIDMCVNRGEVVCLLGPSGSGKSTFLRCINHLEKIDGGRLSVDGELVGYRQKGDKLYELREKEVARQRQDIGMVFQRFNLFATRRRWRTSSRRPRRSRARAGRRPASAGVTCSSGSGWPTRPTTTRTAVRRPAAARRDRPRAGDAAQAHAVRRADLRAGPRARRRGLDVMRQLRPRA